MLDDSQNSEQPSAPVRLIRLREVQHRVGLGRSTIYRWMDEEKFPRPHPIGDHSIRWLESDIDEWIISKVSRKVAR